MLTQTIHNLVYTTCEADPDVWMKPNYKLDNFDDYDYALVYVGGVLAMGHKPSSVMNSLHKLCFLYDPPADTKRYIGTNIGKYIFDDGTATWYHSSQK